MTERKKYPEILRSLLPFCTLLPGVAVLLYYVIGPAAGYMSSDSTDSIRWAQATLESGHLISKEFSYAAVQPIGGNLVFLPFLALFGYTMTAQVAGLVFFILLFTAALCYLATGLGFRKWKMGVFVSLTVLLLSSSPKLREIMWEHVFYYNLGILFFCLGFGLALRLTRDPERIRDFTSYQKRDWIRLVCIILFSFLAATDGLQTLVCYTLPLVGAFCLEYYMIPQTPLPGKEKKGLFLLLLLVFFWSLMGFLMIPVFTRGVEAGYANAYSTYSGMGEWMENFLGLFNNWLTLFGVSVAKGDPLVSSTSVLNMMRIAGAFFLLFFPFILLIRIRSQKSRKLRLILWGHLLVSAFIIFASTFGNLGRANWRLTPMLGTAILVTLSWLLKNLEEKALRQGVVLLSALSVSLSLLSAATVLTMPFDYGKNDSWHVAARVLEEKGLHYGYANFWWSQRITLISGNRIRIANINESNGKPVANDYQLPAGSYKDQDTDRYFLLLTESDNKKMASWIEEKKESGLLLEAFPIASEPYSSGGFVGSKVYVYVFSENIF